MATRDVTTAAGIMLNNIYRIRWKNWHSWASKPQPHERHPVFHPYRKTGWYIMVIYALGFLSKAGTHGSYCDQVHSTPPMYRNYQHTTNSAQIRPYRPYPTTTTHEKPSYVQSEREIYLWRISNKYVRYKKFCTMKKWWHPHHTKYKDSPGPST